MTKFPSQVLKVEFSQAHCRPKQNSDSANCLCSQELCGLSTHLPPSILVLGDPAEDLRLHLCLHLARPHHHRLLRPYDSSAQERSHAIWLPGKLGKVTQNYFATVDGNIE